MVLWKRRKITFLKGEIINLFKPNTQKVWKDTRGYPQIIAFLIRWRVTKSLSQTNPISKQISVVKKIMVVFW